MSVLSGVKSVFCSHEYRETNRVHTSRIRDLTKFCLKTPKFYEAHEGDYENYDVVTFKCQKCGKVITTEETK